MRLLCHFFWSIFERHANQSRYLQQAELSCAHPIRSHWLNLINNSITIYCVIPSDLSSNDMTTNRGISSKQNYLARIQFDHTGSTLSTIQSPSIISFIRIYLRTTCEPIEIFPEVLQTLSRLAVWSIRVSDFKVSY